MAKVTAMQPQKNRPTFNPNSNYKWEPDDVFEITGLQFASLFHCLSKEINDIGGSNIALKYEAFNSVMDVFKKGIEQGVIVEADNSSITDIEEVESKVNNLFEQRFSDKHHHNHPNS